MWSRGLLEIWSESNNKQQNVIDRPVGFIHIRAHGWQHVNIMPVGVLTH